MDPDVTWAKIKALRAKIKRGAASADDRAELREYQGYLADWLRGGGFAPKGYPTRRGRRR